MDGSSAWPSASGMTFGTPPSTYATRLLVVPRSMPTMRDMRLRVLSEGLAEVVDHRSEIRPSGQPVLEPCDEGRLLGFGGAIPVGEAAHDHRLLVPAPP